jgi:hypothetical protein
MKANLSTQLAALTTAAELADMRLAVERDRVARLRADNTRLREHLGEARRQLATYRAKPTRTDTETILERIADATELDPSTWAASSSARAEVLSCAICRSRMEISAQLCAKSFAATLCQIFIPP